MGDMEAASVNKYLLLKGYAEMYDYANRLNTFADWPFRENCRCTPENMAKAGFVHCPTVNEPDVARCFFCLKELEGWEPNDDPWHEHSKRSGNCGFLGMQKDYREFAVDDFVKLELERFKYFVHNKSHELIQHFQDELSSILKNLRKYFEDKHQCSIDLEL